MTTETAPLLAIDHVTRRFERKPDLAARLAERLGARFNRSVVHAVDDVSFDIRPREIVGLVGESGCGKSTLGRIVAGIDRPTAGRILFKGADVAQQADCGATDYALKVQMIFQDPLDSLNPRHRMGRIVREAVQYHGVVPGEQLDAHVDDILAQCGVDASAKDRYPHQFSGGQRQRIGIARALAVKPELVVCDESVASLDVSIQAQIINLFMDLRDAFAIAYLFVSHDIGVIRHISDRVVVMYLGRVVESGPTAEVLRTPNHPYTQALLAEVPTLHKRHAAFTAIRGEIPSPLAPPSGCHFHPRCPHASERCRQEQPRLREVAPGRQAACHLNDESSS
ncbi:MAG: ABC transporter ATP-binding protein [Rhodoferax sp.]|nr:ABC transporter ATP-binding protein [Rhodoferax sp.]MCB2002219.1 ABC transporter ATP-binding protein [Rhodoferax sp.]MCB2006371.1 ABC transporter ATP-binding protein [Rhodoferax sp.]MCB2039565.1 ABC transporter ATP-binding protein [Rhodoferax sp.]MCP5263389.1 ABC transporter ATP-binding protein [Rhodoferax sp.]